MKGRLLDAIPLSTLTGVGASQAAKLAKIDLHTVQDLLLHLPLRYEDRTQLYAIMICFPVSGPQSKAKCCTQISLLVVAG